MIRHTLGYYLIPAPLRANVNAELESAGLGPDFFSIPVVVGAAPNPTHYGASCSLRPDQKTALEAALPGNHEKRMETDRLSRTGFAAMLAAIAAREHKPVRVQPRP